MHECFVASSSCIDFFCISCAFLLHFVCFLLCLTLLIDYLFTCCLFSLDCFTDNLSFYSLALFILLTAISILLYLFWFCTNLCSRSQIGFCQDLHENEKSAWTSEDQSNQVVRLPLDDTEVLRWGKIGRFPSRSVLFIIYFIYISKQTFVLVLLSG